MTDTSAEAIEEWAREFLEGADHMESIGDAEMEALYRKRAATLRALAAENAALRAERDAAVENAAGWHRCVEAILTIAGLSSALGADEAAVVMRDHLDVAQAEARRLREALMLGLEFQQATTDRLNHSFLEAAYDPADWRRVERDFVDAARAALASEQGASHD